MAQKKVVKKKVSPMLQYMMDTMRDYLLDQSLSRTEKAKRREKLSKHLGKGEGTLKNMYLYGQGHPDSWFITMDFIKQTKQQDIIQFYDSHPFIMKKLSSLSLEQKKMHKNMSKMTDDELSLVNKLIAVGLEANRAQKKD